MSTLPLIESLGRWTLEGDLCDCFFNKTEVKENGGWEKDDDSSLASHSHDPIRCLQNCKTQFLEIVSANYSKTFSTVCTKLTTKGPSQDLWRLYWCDSTYCGVGIDQQVPAGQDREYSVTCCSAGSTSQCLAPGLIVLPCSERQLDHQYM